MICSASADWNSSSINCQMSQSDAVDNQLEGGKEGKAAGAAVNDSSQFFDVFPLIRRWPIGCDPFQSRAPFDV